VQNLCPQLYPHAISSYDKALEIQPQNIAILSDKARSLAALNKLHKAKETLENILKIDPNHVGTLEGIKLIEKEIERQNRIDPPDYDANLS